MSTEEQGTKDLLDESNFKIWKQEIYLLLKSKGLTDFIYTNKIKKVKSSELSEEDSKPEKKKNLIPVDGLTETYFEAGTDRKDLEKDAKAKRYLMNSINNDLAMNIDFISSTAYEVYELIKGLNEIDDNDKIENLKDSLNKTKYIPSQNTSLSIFISNMNIKFNELESLNAAAKDTEKFDYLYNAIPEELAIKSNLISHQENWKSTTEYLIKIEQQLRRLKEKKEKQEEVVSNNVNTKIIKSPVKTNNYNKFNNNKNKNYNKKNYNSNNKNNNNSYNKNNRYNIECWNCGRRGHYADECKFKINNNNRPRKNNKGKEGRQPSK